MKANLILIGIVMIVSAVIGGILWPYTIEAWAGLFNKTVEVEFWQGALLGFCPVLGQATIPIAVATWVLMLFF